MRDTVVCERYGTNGVYVYIGGLGYLERANERLRWREVKSAIGEGVYRELTLGEISDQLKARMITVFVEEPLSGVIYQYGNHGEKWEKIGETVGYA